MGNKVSIILPCYNLEKTIYNSLSSLINQTYKNIEIIVINDLGTDSSIDIIKSFNDDRIKIIDNETNVGVGISKQKGIDNATGDYICFADGDDLYELDYIETMLNECINEDADIVSCGMRVIGTDIVIRYNTKIVANKNEAIYLYFNQSKTHTCNKIYKKSVWENIKYSSRRGLDDTPSLFFAFDNSNKIVFIPYVGFNFYKNPNGLSMSLKNGKQEIYQTLAAIDIMKYRLNKYGNNNSDNIVFLNDVKYRLDILIKTKINKNDFIDEINEIDAFIQEYMVYHNFKVVYALVSGYDDTFVQQVYASILSVKYYNKDLDIYIVTDQNTNKTLTGDRSLSDVANIIVIDVPEKYDNNILISRYLKTHIRSVINGDLLYLDTDTICMNKINIPVFDNHIGMINEANQSNFIILKPFEPQFRLLGYKNNRIMNYFNGGVIFMKDTQLCREFMNDWFILWDKCISTDKNLYRDQPPLYFTNTKYNIIDVLPNPLNYQIIAFGNTLMNLSAIQILHVYGNNEKINKKYFDFIDYTLSTKKFDKNKFIKEYFVGLNNFIFNYKNNMF